ARALALVREAGDVRLEGLFLASSGALEAVRGDAGRAANAFDEAERKLSSVGDPALLAALDAHRGHLSWLSSRAARDTGDRARARAPGRGAAARSPPARAGPPAATSDAGRFARRLLARALTEGVLVVAPGGASFRAPGGDPVELAARPTLARLLDLLARARAE